MNHDQEWLPNLGMSKSKARELLIKMDNLTGPQHVTHVIYHDHCLDGWSAAQAAFSVQEVELIAATYGDPLPELPPTAVVAIVDFSWPKAQLQELHDKVADLVVLDHHKKAKDDLEGLHFCLFDMEVSGAQLAWLYFTPASVRRAGVEALDNVVPWQIAHVADNDLGKHELPDTRAIVASLYDDLRALRHTYERPNTMARACGRSPFIKEFLKEAERIVEGPDGFPRFSSLESWQGTDRAAVRDRGEAILAWREGIVNSALENSWIGTIDRIKVAMTCAPPDFGSSICTALLRKHPEVDAAANLYIVQGEMRWSIRARRGGLDVNEVAKKFGGGGHPAASGFRDPEQRLWHLRSGPTQVDHGQLKALRECTNEQLNCLFQAAVVKERPELAEELNESGWTLMDFSGGNSDKVLIAMEKLGYWCKERNGFEGEADGYWCGFTPHSCSGWNGKADYWVSGQNRGRARCISAILCLGEVNEYL